MAKYTKKDAVKDFGGETDKKGKGRPTKYSKEIALKICETISTSNKSMKTIAKENNLAPSTILLWLTDPALKDFSEMYARAKEEQADYLVEEMLEIADDATKDTIETEKGLIENREWTNRSRLRVDTRKFIASKLKPKKYGDKLDLGLGDTDFEINIKKTVKPKTDEK